MTAGRSVVIHAHFYQPPREEPWLELVEAEPSAAPFHDWNHRIERECYRAVVAARIPAADGRIERVVNTLERISFNVGPTLVEWLEREAPETWNAMLEADRTSRLRLGGHGNALAMPYHHVILPLASRRDKTTEVRWGIADFRRRFGRDPEGMWLPETAVDDETLDVLAEEGIRFTILAPHQVAEAPPRGLPGRYRTANGRHIALFLYDGPLSHDVAFGPLVRDGSRWPAAIRSRMPSAKAPGLVSIATDGETYGHHHRFGEMALAAALDRLGQDADTRIENFASFLARNAPAHEVKLVAPSSWSCVHGVERWRANCGCRMKEGTSQAWRKPLREALDALAVELHARYADEAPEYFPDPWEARDAYATVGLPSHLPVRARELLELQRNTLRMFTSCGWFFDDLAGLETIVCLRYAARAIELSGPDAALLEAGLLERLDAAASNDPALGTGRTVYQAAVHARRPGHLRAAAGYAGLLAIAPDAVRPGLGAYLVGPDPRGALDVKHRRTGAEWLVTPVVHRPRPVSLEVSVAAEGAAAGAAFVLEDLPEHEADQIRLALRRELRQGVLSPEEDRRIADGVLRFERAVGAALVRQLPHDPAEAHGLDLDRLTRTLDLLELERQPVPFDAQTRFYHILLRAPAETRRLLAPFAARFGFSEVFSRQPSAGLKLEG
jgi:uncharacterized protein DUF3536/glycosyl hydrolase family 57